MSKDGRFGRETCRAIKLYSLYAGDSVETVAGRELSEAQGPMYYVLSLSLG